MKKVLILAVLTGQLLSSYAQRCGTDLNLDSLKRYNPQAYHRFMELERFTKDYMDAKNGYGKYDLINPNGIIIIPVVVHVLYNTTGQYNVSDAQIQSQIDVLNKDYRRLNNDATNTPARFTGVAADYGIEFRLATIDPNGNSTTGIERKSCSVSYYDIQQYSGQDLNETAIGIKEGPNGLSAWPSNKYLNIWVCNFRTTSILGYATFPSDLSRRPQYDGVVITTRAFGTIGTSAPFNLGRTGTHEVGHWLNLLHLWGKNGNCDADSVADTPPQSTATFGCPGGVIRISTNCNNGPNGDMYMNYMDATDDACMNMFTQGQKDRSRALFATVNGVAGPRAAMLNNDFAIVVPPNPIRCQEPVSVFNPNGLGPVTWTVLSGPATIVSGQNSNTVMIKSTGTGTIQLRAMAGNYVSTASVSVDQSSVPLTINGIQKGCAQMQLSVAASYPSYTWTSYGDILLNGTSTSLTTTSAQVTASGTSGSVSVNVTNACCASNTAYAYYDPYVRTIDGQTEVLGYDPLSFSVNTTPYDSYYRWYVNDNLVAQGPGVSSYYSCCASTNNLICGRHNSVRVEVDTYCGNTSVAYIDELLYLCGGYSNVKLYPNPAIDEVTLSIDDTTLSGQTNFKEISEVRVRNKEGMLLKVHQFGKGNKTVHFSVAELPANVYFLEVINGENKTMVRMVKK